MKKDPKELRKEELIKNFANNLINHIDSKSSEAVHDATMDGYDSMAGMGSLDSEEALRKAIDMMFGLIPYEDLDD